MSRARENAQNSTLAHSLPAEEWDFRLIDKAQLVTALEYEYIRSHEELRGAILNWQAAAFRLNNLARMSESSFTRIASRRLRQHPQVKNAAAVRIVMECVGDGSPPENVSAFLRAIDPTFPPLIQTLHAQKIAGLFEVFPEPWLTIEALFGPDYLQRRCVAVLSAAPRPPQKRIRRFPADLNLPRAKLIPLFRQWLDQNGQQASYENRRRPGQRALEKWFKRLAAYRMGRAGISYDDAQEMIDRRLADHAEAASLKVMPRYEQEYSWKDAIADVAQSLRGNFISEIRA